MPDGTQWSWPDGVVAATPVSTVSASVVELVYISDLLPVTKVSASDTTFWCDNPTACGPGTPLKRITAAQLGNFLTSRIAAVPPLYATANALSLFTDATLSVVGGALHVVGAIAPAPTDGYVYGQQSGLWTRVLPLAGGTLLGPLFAFRDPQSATEVATKHYVDTYSGGGGVTPPPTGGAVGGVGGGATVGLGGGAEVGLGGGVAALREQITVLEARIAALEGAK